MAFIQNKDLSVTTKKCIMQQSSCKKDQEKSKSGSWNATGKKRAQSMQGLHYIMDSLCLHKPIISPDEGSLQKADENRTLSSKMKESIIPFIWGKFWPNDTSTKQYPSCTIILRHLGVPKLLWRPARSQNPSKDTPSSWAFYFPMGHRCTWIVRRFYR